MEAGRQSGLDGGSGVGSGWMRGAGGGVRLAGVARPQAPAL